MGSVNRGGMGSKGLSLNNFKAILRRKRGEDADNLDKNAEKYTFILV